MWVTLYFKRREEDGTFDKYALLNLNLIGKISNLENILATRKKMYMTKTLFFTRNICYANLFYLNNHCRKLFVPEVLDCFPKGSKRFQKVPKGSKRFQKVPKVSKSFQK